MTTRIRRALALVALAAATSALQGETARVDPQAGASPQLVKRFDFDERLLGNYEDLPMKWVRLSGPGLPAYSAGALDDDVGHPGPPSLRFDIQGGHAACEYVGELPVQTGCDYRVDGYIRTESLDQARAFIECTLLDPFGDVIEGSTRVSELVGGTSDWRPVRIAVVADDLTAKRARLRLWVLQRFAWQHVEPAVDPIVRQDVRARVWFDDISLVRVPRLRLATARPGGIVPAGEPVELCMDVHNSTPDAVEVSVDVRDERDRTVHEARFVVAASTTDRLADTLPDLACGWYRAEARLSGGHEVILARRATFVVAPRIPFTGGFADDSGVVVPRFQPGAAAGLRNLLESLGVGAAKLGLALTPAEPSAAASATELRQLVQSLAEREIDAAATVLAAPHADADADEWRAAATELLMRCASFITTWQVGDEHDLAEGRRLTDEQVSFIHDELSRLVASARVVTPRGLFDEPPAAVLGANAPPGPEVARRLPLGAAEAYCIPPTTPTAAIPWQLAGWLDAPADSGSPLPRWLTVAWPVEPGGPAELRIELARRYLLAKMFAPARLFVPAPFEFTETGGLPAWQPEASFIPVRTLVGFAAGMQPVAALNLAHDSTGIVLRDGVRERLAIWTWAAVDEALTLPLCLGASARAWTLDGEAVELVTEDGRQLVPLRPEPLLITDVDSGLLRLERSVTVDPPIVQPHSPEPRPTVSFTNHYDRPLAGVVSIAPPDGWKIEPSAVPFELASGESLSVPLSITTGMREISAPRSLELTLRLRLPIERVLTFCPSIRVDLLDARLRTTCWWEGEDLIVEQRLTNLSPSPLSFSAFVQGLDRPQQEGAFLDLPAAATGQQRFRMPQAQDLAGGRIWAGIREINGPRRLDQLVDVPPGD